jgi:proteic killer suppression protein
MNKSFKDKETEKVYGRQLSCKLPAEIQQVALRKLRMINNSKSLQDLGIPPTNNLGMLKGDREGQHGVRINNQWRICFTWKEGDAYEVEIVDWEEHREENTTSCACWRDPFRGVP